MKKSPFFIFAFLFLYFSATAQNSPNATFGGVGYFGFRMNKYDLKSLNQDLTNNSIPALPEFVANYGGGGQAYIGRFIIGGEGHGFQTVEKYNGTYKSRYMGGTGFFQVGYLLLNKQHVMLSPLAGFGGGYYTIEIFDATPSNYPQILANPRQGAILKTEQFLMDLGFQANVFPLSNKFFSIGLKAGYQFAPIQSSWNDYNGTLANGPNFNPNALYGQINFTFGGFSN